MDRTTILALDGHANGAHAQINIYHNDGNLIKCFSKIDSTVNSSKGLVTTADYLIKESGLTLEDINIVAVCSGPGTFTSMRTVVATANAIAFSKKLACFGISTFVCLLEQNKEVLYSPELQAVDKLVCVAPAYSAQVYVQEFKPCECKNDSSKNPCQNNCFYNWVGSETLCITEVELKSRLSGQWANAFVLEQNPTLPRVGAIASAAFTLFYSGQKGKSLVEINYCKPGLV